MQLYRYPCYIRVVFGANIRSSVLLLLACFLCALFGGISYNIIVVLLKMEPPQKKKKFHEDWEQFRAEARQARQNADVKKGKFVNYITAQRVSFNGRKYEVKEDRQNIKYKKHLDYTEVCRHIKEYYEPRYTGYKLTLVLGVNGPRVFNTDELQGKIHFLVLFEENNDKLSRQPLSSRPYITSTLNKSLQVADSACSAVLYPSASKLQGKMNATKSHNNDSGLDDANDLSICPQSFDRDAILAAAQIITDHTKMQRVQLQSFERINGTWVWLPKYEVTMIIGGAMGCGTFRVAYNCTICDYGNLPAQQYIVKKWKDRVVQDRMQEYSRSNNEKSCTDIQLELSKRACQTQAIARNITKKFKLALEDSKCTFGCPVMYIKTFLVKAGEEYFTLEKKLPGKFVKYINNDMKRLLCENDIGEKASALAHFSIQLSGGAVLLTDIQGCGYNFTDSEIATIAQRTHSPELDDFGIGNMNTCAFWNYKQWHKCNKYCKMAKLQPLQNAADKINNREYPIIIDFEDCL